MKKKRIRFHILNLSVILTLIGLSLFSHFFIAKIDVITIALIIILILGLVVLGLEDILREDEE